MASQWKGMDLRLKADRDIAPDAFDTVAYAHAALNSLKLPGIAKQSKEGVFSEQTKAAVLEFQKQRDLATTGILDQRTWSELDWLVYDGWKACASTLTTADIPRGLAILEGRNRHSGERVNNRGLTRESQRLADVVNEFVAVDFRRNFAVDRPASGSTTLSRHALGAACDLKTDLDRTGTIEPHEFAQCDAVADYLFMRAQGWPVVTVTRTIDGVAVRDQCRGPDRIRVMVWTNHELPDGTRRFSNEGSFGKDFSWSAKRNTWKAQTKTVHKDHFHADTAPGGAKLP